MRHVQYGYQDLRSDEVELLTPVGGANSALPPQPGGPKRILILMMALLLSPAALAETAAQVLSANAALVEKASRQTIAPVIDSLATSGDPVAARVLQAWASKSLGLRKSDRTFFLLAPADGGFALTNLTGTPAGNAARADMTELKPNAGVRGLIESARVTFTLSDPDPLKRATALTSIARDPNASLLAPCAPRSTANPMRPSRRKNSASTAC